MANRRATEPAPQSPYPPGPSHVMTQEEIEEKGARQRTADQDEVIQDFRQVVEATPDDHPDRASRLHRLGAKLYDRYERTGQVDDMNQAIHYYHQAVKATPDKHPDRASLLQSLGAKIHGRYHRIGKINDLDQSIRCFQQAIKATRATPNRQQERAKRFAGAGAGLRYRYKRTGLVDDINHAIQYCHQAVEATPDDHPDRARRFQELGAGLHDRYQKTGQAADLQKSTEALKASCFDPLGLPIVRINAGKEAAQILVAEQNWEESSHVLNEVVQLLPQATPPTDSRNNWQRSIRTFSGLASLTASVLLKAGKSPFTALQALESGRGMIASLIMDVRWDVSKLESTHSQLWDTHRIMRYLITGSNGKGSQLIGAMERDERLRFLEDLERDQRRNRRDILKKFNDLQNEIRQCPGFERFGLPPTEEELRGMAQDGPLVCFNVSNVSSEAFLVTTTGIQVMHLPDLKENDIQRGVRLFASRGNSARRDASLCESDEEEEEPLTSDLSMELLSMWKHAVKPVLDQLGLLGQEDPPHRLPRIWWVGGGLMALVPLHAAGDHILGSTENTLSHVISSYAQTFKALQFARSKPQFSTNSRSSPKVAIISMPITPEGHKTLQLTEEVAAIQNQSKVWGTVTSLDRPSKRSVEDALKDCSIAHLACHATADQVEPAKSALLLGRDVLEKLTLKDIMDIHPMHPDQAQIAYLSACSTAEIKVRNLADESIHLANAFQLAGFTNVIGTLWAADDNAAVEIASKFYEGLDLYDEEGTVSVAYALHHAVLRYRNEHDNRLAVTKWAPFIHLGC
jgi:tetratricopeptide (TPR) repeat protein